MGWGGAGPCVLLRSADGVRSAAECGSERSVKQLCNPLDADQGAPLSRRGPSDWLGVGTRDRHVAVLAQPAWVSLETEWRCCELGASGAGSKLNWPPDTTGLLRVQVFGDKDADGFYRGEGGGRTGYIPCNMVSEVTADSPAGTQQLLQRG